MKWVVIITAVLVVLIAIYFLVNAWIMHGVKSPAYQVIRRSGTIEVRRYAPMLIAQVVTTGDRQTAINIGFKQLAAFIFKENHTNSNASKPIKMTTPVLQQPTKIAMTAPVLQQSIDNKQWQVSFVMPAGYTKATLPKPNNKSINIIENPSEVKAVIRFTGTPTQKRLRQKTLKLERYLHKHRLISVGEIEYAFYNPPWTLPLFRRNEIMQRIKNDLS